MIPIFFDGLLQRLGLRRGCCVLSALDGFIGLWTGQNSHRFGDVHVQSELEVDFLVLLIDLKEQVSRGGSLLLLFLGFFEHFLCGLAFQNLRIQYIAAPQQKALSKQLQQIAKITMLVMGKQTMPLPSLYNCDIQIAIMFFSLINPYYSNNQEIPKDNHIVNATQLTNLSRKEILKHLIKNGKIPSQALDYNIITSNPRNFYIDILLAKNYELYFDEDQVPSQEPAKIKRMIKLPINFEIVTPDPEFKIDCQTELITTNHFNTLRKIGEGTYAEIFLIERKYDKQLFCMKRINKAECREKGNLLMIKNEYEILEYPSKYKVKLFYRMEDQRYAYFVQEFCVYGDLYSTIKSNKKADENNRMTLTQKYLIWIQVAFGIISLHEKGLIYRDLKPENILLNQNGEVKICDFGFTSRIEPGEKMKELCGSYEYLAPEIIKKEGYNKAVDIYCLGLLFYELLTGSNPFEGVTPETISEMKSKTINYQKKSLSNTVKDLLRKMLKEKPEERIGYEQSLQLFKHQFFKENEDLVHKVIKNKVLIKNLKYSEPAKLSQRQELYEKVAYIFPYEHSFNYLKPFFDVTENVGPKLNFTK